MKTLNTEQCICESNPPADGWISVDLADLPKLDSGSVLTLTSLDTGVQQVLDCARLPFCFPVAVGAYRLAIHMTGHEAFRDLVTVKPGEQVMLRPSIRKVDEPVPTLQTVLAKLQAPNVEIDPRDLDVPPNTTVVLDGTHAPYAADCQQIMLNDVDAAKQIIGIEDAQWGISAARYGYLREGAEFTPTAIAAQAAKEYIYGNSATVSEWKSTINSQIFHEPWLFYLFGYGVVTIHAGGVLRITDKSSFFICQKLRMHTTAKLVVTGRGPGVIWPLSYESFCAEA